MSESRKVIGFNTLVMMTITCVFGFRNVINQYAELGPASISLWLIGTVVYFLPMVLMMGEMASANAGKKSGIYSWIESTLGSKWAFYGSWTYFFANMFYFTVLTSTLVVYFSWGVTGRNFFGQDSALALAITCIGVFWLVTFSVTKGVGFLSKLAQVAGAASMGLSLLFIIAAIISVFVMDNAPAQAITVADTLPSFSDWNTLVMIGWLLFAFAGGESIGVYIGDTKGGSKTFVKAITVAALLIGVLYCLGGYAVSLVVEQNSLDLTNGIFTLFLLLGEQLGLGHWVVNIVGVTLAIASLGGLAVWVNSSIQVMFSELPEGILPEKLTERDENDIPANALWIQAAVVSVLFIVPALGIDSVETLMKTIISMSALNLLVPTIFLILGYMGLRIGKSDMPREFKMVRSDKLALLISSFLLTVFLLAAVVTSIPAPELVADWLNGKDLGDNAHPMFTLLINIGGLVFYLGMAKLLWSRYESRQAQAGFEPAMA
ncbi:amino acid permease [Endozoicomonas lisbonensis]|uniref:Amino acid transporter n=1 Tax=Endozoicomonas lisbonensis TaxID=3120522 RepID=A0ABV2SMN0_9GAMM